MTNAQFDWLKWISEVQSIAQAGLTYSENGFDKERYAQLRHLVAELAAHCSGNLVSDVANIFALEKGYTTPKRLSSKKVNCCLSRNDQMGCGLCLVAGLMLMSHHLKQS